MATKATNKPKASTKKDAAAPEKKRPAEADSVAPKKARTPSMASYEGIRAQLGAACDSALNLLDQLETKSKHKELEAERALADPDYAAHMKFTRAWLETNRRYFELAAVEEHKKRAAAAAAEAPSK